MKDYLLYSFLLVFLYLIVVNIVAVVKSKRLNSYLSKIANSVPTEKHFDSIIGSVYFEDDAFSTRVSVNKRGVYLQALFKYSVVIPWDCITAIRVLDLKGSTVANLRVSVDGSIDRRLTIPWNKLFNDSIPEYIAIVFD